MNHTPVLRVREAILARLTAASAPVSGDALGRELNISRAAIWKHIRALRGRGVRISAHGGLGYTLESDVLSAEWMRMQLKTFRIGRPCIVLDTVDSTNSEAMRLAGDGAKEGLAVLSEHQSAGRGRLGRRWHTIAEDTLAMSVLLRPKLAPAQAPQLSLLAAVAMHEALAPLAPDIRVKWPNDLVCHGRKLAGILTEMRAEPDRVQAVVIGMGVNVRAPREGWPKDIGSIATDLASASARPVTRMEVARRILESLDRVYISWLDTGFGPVREQWWRAHAACGKPVRVHHGAGYIEGIAETLDADGALLLRTQAGIERVIAGDMELLT